MFFKKKEKKESIKCENCDSLVSRKYSFCPHCGYNLLDLEEEMKDFGMLGRSDLVEEELIKNSIAQNSLGITDKILGSLVNSLMKNLDKQFRTSLENAEIKTLPNGIKIKIGMQQERKPRKSKILDRPLTAEQLKRISSLPKTDAKTNVKRLSDKIIYEINAPGLSNVDDVIVSKLESGYEIKAIGDKKVYVKNVPINLPLYSLYIDDSKLFVEFKTL